MGVKGFPKGHFVSQETREKISKANDGNFFALCDYCGKKYHAKKFHYEKSKKHFCCRDCYYNFVKEKLPFNEQNAYKGVRQQGETKQVYHRNYCKNHPENISHLKANRYAREKGAIGSHTLKEWQELKLRYNNKCAICGLAKPLTKDHIIPLSKSGTNKLKIYNHYVETAIVKNIIKLFTTTPNLWRCKND